MISFLYVLFAIVSLLLVILVLIQQGKGAGAGLSIGGGASQAMFGGSGGRSFFIKLTAGLAAAFLILAVVLARLATTQQGLYKGALAGVESQPQAAAPIGAAPQGAAPQGAAPVAPAPAQRPQVPASK